MLGEVINLTSPFFMLQKPVLDIINEANEAYEKRDWHTVISACESLLASGQQLSHTYYLLGMANLSLGSYAIARHFFEQSDKIKPLHPAVLNNLATCEHELNRREEAIKYYKKAIQVGVEKNDKQIGLYYSNLAGVCTGYGMAKEAEKYINLALKFGANHWSVYNNLAVVLLEQGRYKEGFDKYHYRLENIDIFKPKNYREKILPQWNGEENSIVVIYGEQGLGDEIMFASLLEAAAKDMKVKNCKVVFDCNNRLLNIFRQSFPDLEIYGTKNYAEQSERTWDKRINPTHQLAIGSLTKFYWDKRNTKPYIKINNTIKIEGNKPKIGFSWYGGVAKTNIYYRYIPLEKWKEIFKLPYDFVSLQYNPEAHNEITKLRNEGFENVHHNSEIMADIDKTAELINGLDLIIGSPQTALHLAAAMGKPTWQLTPKCSMWQMNAFSDFYECGETIKQTTNDWSDVMDLVKERLEDADFTKI
jgi:tetratricopeptide (TPR) repeat protein